MDKAAVVVIAFVSVFAAMGFAFMVWKIGPLKRVAGDKLAARRYIGPLLGFGLSAVIFVPITAVNAVQSDWLTSPFAIVMAVVMLASIVVAAIVGHHLRGIALARNERAEGRRLMGR